MTMERAVFVSDLDRLPPAPERYDRLYLGSEFCTWRLPGERDLHRGFSAAHRRAMGFSLVTPFLDECGLVQALELARALPADPGTEIVANDLGLIEALRAAGWTGTIVAGRLLTRQRRGPGFETSGDVPPDAAAALRGSALDSPAFVGLLGSTYGVRRFELDDLVQGVAIPPLSAGVRVSLYRPWLLVTATRNCPWVFDGRTWDRTRNCGSPCSGRALRLSPVDVCAPTPVSPGSAKGWREAGDPGAPRHVHGSDVFRGRFPGGSAPSGAAGAAVTPAGPVYESRPLILGGCAQFLEHRNDAPPPEGVDRIVWQPEIPA
jgi:hypothetical protein